MVSLKTAFTQERLGMAGDALVVTAAAFSLITAVTAVLAAPTGTPTPGMEWATVLGSILSMVVVVIVPVLVWLMYGRRLSGMAVLGGVLGAASTQIAFMAVVALSALLGLLASPFTAWEFAGPVAMLVLGGLAFVGVVLWRAVDAVRDLASGTRAHPRIDILRLLSTVVLVVFSVGLAVWITQNPGDETAEAFVFVLLVGLGGALAVSGAETLTALSTRKSAPPASPATTAGTSAT